MSRPTIELGPRLWAAAILIFLAGCGAPNGEHEAAVEANSESVPSAAVDSVQSLPSFDDYPAGAAFTGTLAAVDLESHPEAKSFRTKLTRDAEAGAKNARYAGHYRIVVVGCGASCKSVWAINLVDGSVHNVFTASYSVAFRPDSRLIVENDQGAYESLLDEMEPAEVESIIETYGAPRFWVENGGKFARVGPDEVRLDADSGRLVAASRQVAGESWRCVNDLEVRCGDGACAAQDEGAFTPMSIAVEGSGSMSVCAYSGCWEGVGEVFEAGRFLMLAGRDLEFSTSPGPQARADVLVAIDRADRVGTLKTGEFALPLLCQPSDVVG